MAPKTEARAEKPNVKVSAQGSGTSVQKLAQLSKSSQLYWYAAHVASIASFALWQVLGLFSARKAQKFSRLTLFFQLVSYSIVIWKSVPLSKTRDKAQLLRNENVQYFAFAAMLLISSLRLAPWTKAVTPFIIYSFFHLITFFQKKILEHVPVSKQTQAAISDRISYVSANFNVQALYFTSLSELMLLLDIALALPGLIFAVFRNPVYIVFFGLRTLAVLVFLKLRYDESQYTRETVQQVDGKIASVLNHPMAPPQLRAIYYGPVKTTISKYAGLILVPKIASAKKTQ